MIHFIYVYIDTFCSIFYVKPYDWMSFRYFIFVNKIKLFNLELLDKVCLLRMKILLPSLDNY